MKPARKLNSSRRRAKDGAGAGITVRNLQKRVPLVCGGIKAAIARLLALEGVNKPARIDVCVVSDAAIRKLNKKYLGRGTTTDVLAFDTGVAAYPGQISADIIVCADTAVRNAGIFGTSAVYEVYLYAVHGMLHMLGYDDRTAEGRRLMQCRAERFLSYFKPRIK